MQESPRRVICPRDVTWIYVVTWGTAVTAHHKMHYGTYGRTQHTERSHNRFNMISIGSTKYAVGAIVKGLDYRSPF
ncbi:MAG: hypothetical protein NVSMB31_10710 [Vulcanimicrobiaceae bacterium]